MRSPGTWFKPRRELLKIAMHITPIRETLTEVTLSEEKSQRPGWKDYVALFIASLETILLPVLIFVLIVLLLVVYFDFIR